MQCFRGARVVILLEKDCESSIDRYGLKGRKVYCAGRKRWLESAFGRVLDTENKENSSVSCLCGVLLLLFC